MLNLNKAIKEYLKSEATSETRQESLETYNYLGKPYKMIILNEVR